MAITDLITTVSQHQQNSIFWIYSSICFVEWFTKIQYYSLYDNLQKISTAVNIAEIIAEFRQYKLVKGP